MERRIGVTAQQRLIVRCVGAFPGMNAGQLARLLHLDPGTISAALGRLEAKRLLTRRSDAADRRRVTLRLTARGRALDVPTKGTAEEAVEELLGSLTASHAAKAGELLDALAERLDSKNT
ncbi:MAG: MarR family transcriptional regulator [Myxococcaceae bacterium]|nr:MarR family transcriptional regulator [Myxococcaceae bacterium]